ncbi:uncharacterized protein LOC131844935 [Achroia grisella]|uniref:uncharacterized protein LOC131844935 n=1 Tax=Achroia grisella TaxID=688607 RepID=UPI0027D1EB5B|nr:uncharacterized protein LOC131844935 [Achroia grisella]
MYCQFMSEYEMLGHMNRIDSVDYPNYFLPHHGVFRENSSTTKLRVVFNASAASSSDKSLNDIQLPAPALQNDIPKLELCGALVGAKLYKKVIESLRLTFNRVFFWTDSTIVISWVQMSPHLLKPFVQNRVTEINELTNDSIWFHVASGDNPADLLSRGLNLDMLASCDLWWTGPPYLRNPHFNIQDHVKSVGNEKSYINVLPELRSQDASNFICVRSEVFVQFENYSSFNKLRRTWAYVLRFLNNTRNRIHRSDKSIDQLDCLSVDELNASELILAKFAQMQSFPELYERLLSNLPIKSNGKEMNRISGLNVFLDAQNIIRVGGRLGNATTFDYDKKHPILLCNKHHFSPLTPGHFLIGRPLTAPPVESLLDVSTSRLSRYHYIEQLRQQFWQRWSREYVSELQQRTKWKTQQKDIKLDALVILKDDNLPPLKWRLGRIKQVYPGADGVSRVADIYTAAGVTRRAFSKICPLPLQPEDN